MKAILSYGELASLIEKQLGVHLVLEQGQDSGCVIVRHSAVPMPICVQIVSVENDVIVAKCKLEQQRRCGLISRIFGGVVNMGIDAVLRRIPPFPGLSIEGGNTVNVNLRQIDKMAKVLETVSIDGILFDLTGCVVTASVK